MDPGWLDRIKVPEPDHLMNGRFIQVIQVGSTDWVASGSVPKGKVPLENPIIWGPDQLRWTGDEDVAVATSLPAEETAEISSNMPEQFSTPGSSQENPIALD